MKRKLTSLFVVTLWLASTLLTSVSPVSAQGWDDLASDLDRDGLLNELETDGWYSAAGGPFETDPYDADSDDDGLTDGEEKAYGTDPTDAHDPGLYVRYQDSFYTQEYFHVTDPAYLAMKRAGDSYLLTEAMVVRRGTSFRISGPVSSTLSIDGNGNGYTTSIPAIDGDYDPYEGGWSINVPANGRVGIFTATISSGGWSHDMPIYVIFEIPSSLSDAEVEAFLYDDDPDNLRDETAVIWRTQIIKYCFNGDTYPCSHVNYRQRRASGFAQVFWTEHFKKMVFVDLVMPTIHGRSDQDDATDDLSNKADDEVRVDWSSDRYIKTDMSTTLYRYVDPEDPEGRETQEGSPCQSQAGAFASFLRSAGIPASPFITDHKWSSYDTSVKVWFEYGGTPQWMAARSYARSETDDTYKYYPFTGGDTDYRLMRNWTYSESYENVLVTINEDWEFEQWVPKEGATCPNYFESGLETNECYVEGTVGDKWVPDPYMKHFSREYKWDSYLPLEWVAKNPLVESLTYHNWTARSWVPTSPPWGYDYYDLPVPYPGGDTSENWPIDPVAQDCPPGITKSVGCPYPNAIGNLVWEDSDGDGERDGGELGIAGAVVTMTLTAPYTVYTDTTNSSGAYEFAGLPTGVYVLTVNTATLPISATLTTGNDPLTVTIETEEESYADADFGFHIPGGGAMAILAAQPTSDIKSETPAALAAPSNHIFLPLVSRAAVAQTSPVLLGEIVNDYGVDSDGNERLDTLVLEVEVDVRQAGDYTLGATLAIPDGITPYGGVYAENLRAHLDAGEQTIQLSFSGLAIGSAQAGGPYGISDLWVTDVEDFDFHMGPWDLLLDHQIPAYTTAAYTVDQFEALPASLSDIYTHRGVDSDGDGRYEAVAIDIPLEVVKQERFHVEGDLYDAQGDFAGHATWSGAGETASLLFDLKNGAPPYTLDNLRLFEFNGRGNLLDARSHDVYTFADLGGAINVNLAPDPSGFRLMGEHITPTQVFNDRTTDLDGDGLYDQLIIDVQVQVDQADEYRVEGWLQAPDGNLVVYGVSEPISLSVGAQMTLSLPFDGRAINGHGVVSGTYTVVALKILDEDENSYTVLDKVHVTGLELDYDASDFEPASRATTIFSDDMESGTGNWSAQSPWSDNSAVWPWPTENWKAETSTALSGTLSLTPTLSFDLSNYAQPVLRFNTTYSIPSGGNFGYLEASSNGGDWTPMAAYTDTDRWTTELLDLSDFGETPDLQFRFNADSQTGLLWYVDDVHLNAWPAVTSAGFDSSPNPVLRDETVTFTSTYTSITGTLPITYTWDFDDGSPIEVTTAPTVTHQFTSLLTYTVQLTVENPYDTAVASDTISVVNAAPTGISLSNNTIAEGEPIGAIVGLFSTTDPDSSDTHTYTLVSGAGDTGNGSFTIVSETLKTAEVFDYETQHTYSIRVQADDGHGGTYEEQFTITITDINDAPTFTSAPVATATEDVAYSYDIVAEDADAGDTLTITAPTLPGWLALNDAGDGTATLTGTPDNDDVGDWAVTLQVRDTAGLTDTQTFTITVANVNDAPVFTSTPVEAATEDAAYSYNIAAEDEDAGDALTITAPILPGWLILTGNGNGAATLEGTPDNGDVGDCPVTLQVRDTAGLTDTQIFTITVSNVNDAPTDISLSSDSIAENEPASTVVGDLAATDPDSGDSHTYALVAGVGDAGNGSFAIVGDALKTAETFDYETQITYTIRVSATDSGGLDYAKVFTITVTDLNDAPVFTSTPVEAATEDAAYSYNIAAEDVDAGDALTITAPILPGWLNLNDAGDGTATLTGTPTNGDVGDWPVILQVRDTAGLTDNQTFTITVSNVNDAPTDISLSSDSIAENEPASTVVGDLAATDPDSGDSHTYALVSGAGDAGNGSFAIVGDALKTAETFDYETQITYTIRVSATDSGGLDYAKVFTITVTDLNDAPVFTSTPVEAATEDAAYSYNIAAEDADAGDALTITAPILPGWLNLNDAGDGTATLEGTPDNSDVGDWAVTLQVQDTAGLTDTQIFTITVSNVNDTPVFTSTPIVTATEDVAYSYDIAASDADAGDALTITAPTLPSWLILTVTGNGTATLTGSPDNDDVGDCPVTLQVRDTAGLTAIQTFTITVANVNDAPTFSSAPIIVATEDVIYNYDIVATDVDAGDTLTITAPVLPAWLALTDNGDGTATLTGTPGEGSAGEYAVELQAEDAAGAIGDQDFIIKVSASAPDEFFLYLPMVLKK